MLKQNMMVADFQVLLVETCDVSFPVYFLQPQLQVMALEGLPLLLLAFFRVCSLSYNKSLNFAAPFPF
jgi:hypothetical protein